MDGLLGSQKIFTTRQMGFPALNPASIKYHGTDFLPLFEETLIDATSATLVFEVSCLSLV